MGVATIEQQEAENRSPCPGGNDTLIARTLRYQENKRRISRRIAAEEYLMRDALSSMPDPRSTVAVWEWTDQQ